MSERNVAKLGQPRTTPLCPKCKCSSGMDESGDMLEDGTEKIRYFCQACGYVSPVKVVRERKRR